MSDLISRQAAIDLFEERLNGWTLEEAIPIVDRFVNEREQCDDVWHAVVTIRDIAECVKQDVEKYLPSAEPEIIRCKECEHWDTSWQNDYAPNYHYCPLVDGTRRDDFYCADAEMRGEA